MFLWLGNIGLTLPLLEEKLNLATGLRWTQNRSSDANSVREQQSLLAAYLEASYKWLTSLSSTLGVRFERWQRYQAAPNSNLFFNASVAWKIDVRTQLTLALQQRISRPSLIEQLGVRQYISEVFYYTGNPSLGLSKPLKYELSISRFQGPNFLKLSLFRENSKGLASPYVKEQYGQLAMFPINVNKYLTYGGSIWTDLAFFRGMIMLGFGVNVQHLDLEYQGVVSRGWQWDLGGNLRCRFAKYYALNFMGSLLSRRVQLQGYSLPYAFSNLGLERNWKEGAIALAISVDNVFTRAIKEHRVYHFANNLYEDLVRYYNRGVRLVFVYRFGKGKPMQQPDKDQQGNIIKHSL